LAHDDDALRDHCVRLLLLGVVRRDERHEAREDALGDLGLRVRHAPRRADRVAHELALLVLDVPAEPSRRGDSINAAARERHARVLFLSPPCRHVP
jgi:hypothetical protein